MRNGPDRLPLFNVSCIAVRVSVLGAGVDIRYTSFLLTAYHVDGYCQYKYVHLQMHESEWTEDFYVISKTGVQRCTLSDVFIFDGHDAGYVAQAESRTLINANFVSGRDLFVCLTYAPEASRSRALEKFHAKMKKAYAKRGLTYKYIAVTEEHDMDGEPVRLHHHLILSGAYSVQLAEVVRECWISGLADVRTLREGADFFEDTAMYLLKDDKNKGKGARRYSTSRNLTPPAEPVRLRLGEEEEAEVPPGVKMIEHVQNANEFGRYEIMVGRIYDHTAFDTWWQIQRRKAAPDPWERLRRRRQRKV